MLKHLVSCKLIDKFFLASLILGVILYQKFPFLKITGVAVRIRLEDFLMAALGIYVVITASPKLKTVFQKPIERSVVTFILVGLLSLISGLLITKNISPAVSALHWVRRIEYFIPLFFALFLGKSAKKEYLLFVIKLLAISIFFIFIYGFGQKQFGWPVIVTQNEEYSKGVALRYVPGAHVTSTFAGHYDLASFLVLVLPAIVASFVVLKDRLARIVMGIAFICGLWLLANSLSRISVAAYLISVVITLLILKKFKALAFVLAVSLVVFAFSSDLLDRYIRIIEVVKDSVSQLSPVSPNEVLAVGPTLPGKGSVLSVFEDRSASIRFNVEWPRAIRAFTKNPLLGTGYSSITLATDNDYLRLLGEVGLLGFAGFILIILNIVISIVEGVRDRLKASDIESAFLAGVTGGFIGTLINAVFIDVFEASKFAIIFWLLICILVYSVRSRDSYAKAR